MFRRLDLLHSAVLAAALMVGLAPLGALTPWLNSQPVGAQAPVYFAVLTGSEAIPPNDSEALGTFVAQIEGDAMT